METLDPLRDPRWRDFVEGCPDALIFHHPAWLGLLHEQYGYSAGAWCAVDAAGRVLAGLPVVRVSSRLTGSRLVAVPFCDLCGLLVARDEDTARGALIEAIADERTRAGLDLEIHERVPGLRAGSTSQRFWHHSIGLSDGLEAVQAGFTKSHIRRGTAKARRLGLVVQCRRDAGALDAFYALHLETRRRQGVPIQPKRFIRRFESLFAAGLGFVALVEDDGRPAAAAVFLAFNGTLTYKYGASDRSLLSKRPNNLLFSEAIRWACERSLRTLDLGRTDLDNQGLREFKLAWGAQERELSYTLVSEHPRGPRGTRGRRAMGLVIRRSPPVVARLVGEALYRHAG